MDENRGESAGESPAERRRLWAQYRAISTEDLKRVCEVDAFVASGPGGQHRNKTETGIRVTHAATGLVARATERRSQGQNLDVALERLRAMLLARYAPPPKPRKATKPSRGSVERRLGAKLHRAKIKEGRRGE